MAKFFGWLLMFLVMAALVVKYWPLAKQAYDDYHASQSRQLADAHGRDARFKAAAEMAQAERRIEVARRKLIAETDLPPLRQSLNDAGGSPSATVNQIRVIFDAETESLEIKIDFAWEFKLAYDLDELLSKLVKTPNESAFPWKTIAIHGYRLERFKSTDVYGNTKVEDRNELKFKGIWPREEIRKIQWQSFRDGNLWRLSSSRWKSREAISWDDAIDTWKGIGK